MRTRQTIAIIGASGKMGSALSKSLSKGNYRLLLLDKNPERLKALVAEIRESQECADVELIDCYVEACWEADIIIPAIPYCQQVEVAAKIREMANQKIVISLSNPFNETMTGLVTEAGTSAGEEMQALLPHTKVVKAFNTTPEADFSQPVIDGKQVDALLAGDDPEALETVSELVATAGFNPVIAGGLSMSRTLEQMQLLLVQLSLKNQYMGLAGWKILHA